MELKNIRTDITELSQIVDGWIVAGKIPEIERDIVLERLRGMYDAIRFSNVELVPEAPAEVVVAAIVPEVAEDISIDLDMMLDPETSGEELASDLETEDENNSVAETEPEVTEMIVEEVKPEITELVVEDVEPEVADSVVEEVEPTVIVENKSENEKQSQQTIASLFNFDDVELHRRKRRVIMSLYGDDPKLAVKQEVMRESSQSEEPNIVEVFYGDDDTDDEQTSVEQMETATETIAGSIAEPKAVLGDVINHDVQTLADTLSTQKTVVSDVGRGEHITDLRKAIGLNDNFLIIHDLFDGDSEACQIAIDELNTFDNLDDCMIYIADNYDWNPNSDGAKFIMELLERKFA